MPVYQYKALDASGKALSGIVDADSAKEARQKLRMQSLYTTSIAEAEKEVTLSSEVQVRKVLRRIKRKDISTATRQLATLLRSGMPVVQSFSAIIEQLEGQPLQKVMLEIREKVNSGSTFADALADHPKLFSTLYVGMVRAGESAGALETILQRLAEYLEKTDKQRNRIRSIMAYPIVMLFVGGAVLTFLMTYVVPTLIKLFTEMNRDLPLPTQILIAISSFVRSYKMLILIGGIVAAFVAFKRYIRTEAGRLRYDAFRLRIPVLGTLVRKSCMVRFARTLGTLVAGGVPLLQALVIVRDIVGNTVIGKALDDAKDNIARGQTIADPLKNSGHFPPIVTHMVAVGEASGNLEEMLFNVADAYEDEVETAISSLTSLLEPMIIVVMGVIVGFIVLSVLLPIFDMNKLAG
ncbi:MAG: type II secretion system inner membrane protein GspF [bacterium]|nr:type II secretion system inner membrane protein GspF [bacterium]